MSRLNLKRKLPLKYLPDFKIILAAVLYYLVARLGYFLAVLSGSCQVLFRHAIGR